MSFYEYNTHYEISSVDMDADPERKTKCYFYAFKTDPRDAKYETFMDFDTWLPFYNGDPDNWHYVNHCGAMLPFYVDEKGMCHFIKFTSRRDYYKMKKVFNEKAKSMKEEANLQEQIELSTIIRKRALKRSKEALEKQKKAEEELRNLTEQMRKDISMYGNRSLYNDCTVKRISDNKTLKPRTWEETI